MIPPTCNAGSLTIATIAPSIGSRREPILGAHNAQPACAFAAAFAHSEIK
jgi:hypothetical protein